MKSLITSLGVVASGLYAYARYIEPVWTQITRLHLCLPHLHPAFNGYRIVQISDTHSDTWMTRDRLCALIEQVNALEPDLVAMTGDFVSHHVKYEAAELIACFSRMRPRDAAVAVLGNHDYHSGEQAIRDIIRQAGVIDLSNRIYTVRRGEAALHIGGVDDVWAQAARLDLVLAALPADGAAILLVHEPDFADVAAATGRFDLQLSGHTHGGQINIPMLRELVLPVHGTRYRRGLYQVKDMALYVNRGAGMVGLPLRFCARPEIAVLTLRSAAP